MQQDRVQIVSYDKGLVAHAAVKPRANLQAGSIVDIGEGGHELGIIHAEETICTQTLLI